MGATATAGEGGLRAVRPLPHVDVIDERMRQLDKWGVQDHPSVAPELKASADRLRASGYPASYAVACVFRDLGIPTATRAREDCQARSAKGDTWAHIIVEELAEAVEAATLHGDGPELRAEVVQVAAVAVAWLEALDRRA